MTSSSNGNSTSTSGSMSSKQGHASEASAPNPLASAPPASASDEVEKPPRGWWPVPSKEDEKLTAARRDRIFRNAAQMMMRPAVTWAFTQWRSEAEASRLAKVHRVGRGAGKAVAAVAGSTPAATKGKPRKKNAMFNHHRPNPSSPSAPSGPSAAERASPAAPSSTPMSAAEARLIREEEMSTRQRLATAQAELSEDSGDERGVSPLLNEVGELLRSLGQLEAAQSLFTEALDARRAKYGPAHPATLTSQNNLGLLLLQMGNHEAAHPLLLDATKTRRDTQGRRHPETLTAMNNLASLHKARNELDAAVALYREALDARREALGSHNPDTLTSINNLASCLMGQGKLHEAEPLLVEASRTSKKVLGRDHPHSRIFARNLSRLRQHPMMELIHREMGREEEDFY